MFLGVDRGFDGGLVFDCSGVGVKGARLQNDETSFKLGSSFR
jgi:hypothetical protein